MSMSKGQGGEMPTNQLLKHGTAEAACEFKRYMYSRNNCNCFYTLIVGN